MPSRNAASASDDRFAARRILARSSAMPARIRFPPAARANSAARDIASSACAVCLRWTAMKASRSVSSAWYPSEPSFAASAKGRRNEFLGLGHPTNLHECVGLADERHEGHLQLRHSTRDLKRSLVEVERLLRTTEFDVTVSEQREPAHQRRGVAACFGDLDCLSEIHDGGVRVALQKGDKPKLAAGAICPTGFTELLGQRKRLGPGALRQRRVQVLVRLAFDDQHAKPKPLVVLNDRIIEVSAETFGDFWNRQSWQLSTQSTDFSVESISPVAAARRTPRELRRKVVPRESRPGATPSGLLRRGACEDLCLVRRQEGTQKARAQHRRCRPRENGRTS